MLLLLTVAVVVESKANKKEYYIPVRNNNSLLGYKFRFVGALALLQGCVVSILK